MSPLTSLPDRLDPSDPRASEELLPLVYAELRKLAAARLAREAPGQTLDATALVHEAYLRLTGGSQPDNWNGRGHFFGAAAEAMRRILIDRARSKAAARHGGQRQRLDLDAVDLAASSPPEALLALDEALGRLEAEHPEAARLVLLRYYAGLTLEACAEALGLSLATAKRRWSFARAWLYRAIEGDAPPEKPEIP